jgi:hypothetical protein
MKLDALDKEFSSLDEDVKQKQAHYETEITTLR